MSTRTRARGPRNSPRSVVRWHLASRYFASHTFGVEVVAARGYCLRVQVIDRAGSQRGASHHASWLPAVEARKLAFVFVLHR
jgi:hypothetical protein